MSRLPKREPRLYWIPWLGTPDTTSKYLRKMMTQEFHRDSEEKTAKRSTKCWSKKIWKRSRISQLLSAVMVMLAEGRRISLVWSCNCSWHILYTETEMKQTQKKNKRNSNLHQGGIAAPDFRKNCFEWFWPLTVDFSTWKKYVESVWPLTKVSFSSQLTTSAFDWVEKCNEIVSLLIEMEFGKYPNLNSIPLINQQKPIWSDMNTLCGRIMSRFCTVFVYITCWNIPVWL